MAFKKPKEQPQFADLKAILANTRTELDNSTYQTLSQLIDRLTQFQMVTLEAIAAINDSINEANTTINNLADGKATYLTVNNETVKLPHSRQELPGYGITFDDSIPNKRTVSAASGGRGYVPMVNGAYPAGVMYIGKSVLMIPYGGDM